MIPPRLEVVAFGPITGNGELLDWLAEELRRLFHFREVVTGVISRDVRWNGPGDQLSSNRVVDWLVDRGEAAGVSHLEQWTLAVTDLDLTAPGRDFVFGEATLGGGWAVVSTARLVDLPAPPGAHKTDAGGDGTPETAALDSRLRQRLLTEAVHELGHLAGLAHCDSGDCVMHPSVTAADADLKGHRFCARCRP